MAGGEVDRITGRGPKRMTAHRMRARLASLAASVLVLSFALPVSADDDVELQPEFAAPIATDSGWLDETPKAWFVELGSAPVAEGGSLASAKSDKTAFRNNARKADLKYAERYAFDNLWNGLSITVASSQLSKLSRIEGVKAIWPVVTVSLPTGGTTPDLATALAMTGADIAQSELGYTGAGVKVAVMDTGIDYDHPDLGGCFGAGCRVIRGTDFVGDTFNADTTSPSYQPIPHPDSDPDDCNGHGTHVAGIVGASGNPATGGARGVAPGVTYGAYRVFGCEGSTTADIMIAAMERALADDMDVLNMSIGSAFQWPQYPTAAASDRLVNKGVVVVASIGNSGANGLFSASAPGLGKKVIGVASYDNTHVQLPTFTVTPAGLTIGYANATGAPAAPTSGSLPLAKSGTPASAADACLVGGVSPFTATQFASQAVLIRRGTCSFYEKAKNAQDAGAAAVVLYNNAAGRVSPTVAGAPAITIPVVAVSDVEGVSINNAINSGAQTLNWTASLGTFPNATGGLISSFSSYGLSPDLEVKPDIGAPGGLIRSTWPLENGGYATISGTSMASPHVAGGVALLLQARPGTSAQDVRGILQNTAVPKPFGSQTSSLLDNVHRQGAGMLQIDKAIQATTLVTPGKLALGESQAGPATRTITVRNTSSAAVTYDLSHRAAVSTNVNTFTPGFFTTAASVTFSQAGLPVTAVTLAAGASATVDATITISDPATAADRRLYGGYLVLTPQGGGQTYRVPYAGFRGDYQSIQVVTPTPNGFPWLARLVGTSFLRQNTGATFTMASGDIPYLLVHLDHQSRRFRVEIIEATSGNSWHRAFDEEYVPRNSTAGGFFAFGWDGETLGGNRTYTVPNGTYVMKLSVTKALGDPSDPAHIETWTSPVFNIARPAAP
jgi:minor extracellular serine protease Vpr